MWLTGRREGPPLGAPSGVVGVMQVAAERLRTMTTGIGGSVHVDGPALLGERASIAGLTRRGLFSCGGSTGLLRAADGWLAVALPRPDDVELLPAWIGVEGHRLRWSAVATAVRQPAFADARRERSRARPGRGRARRTARRPRRRDRHRPRARAGPRLHLHGLRVVDLSSLWAGPLCGQLLADAGMDVIKVESTGRSDGARGGPAAFFDLVNAGKSSVLLDLGERSGIEALRALVATADVVIESTRPRALAQLGIDAVGQVGGRRTAGVAVDHRARPATTRRPARRLRRRRRGRRGRRGARPPRSRVLRRRRHRPGHGPGWPPSPSSTASSPAVGGCSTSPWPASAR